MLLVAGQAARQAGGQAGGARELALPWGQAWSCPIGKCCQASGSCCSQGSALQDALLLGMKAGEAHQLDPEERQG